MQCGHTLSKLHLCCYSFCVANLIGDGNLVVPRQLSLNTCNIEEAGDEKELEKLCCRVCELDLAENAIKEWTQVWVLFLCILAL